MSDHVLGASPTDDEPLPTYPTNEQGYLTAEGNAQSEFAKGQRFLSRRAAGEIVPNTTRVASLRRGKVGKRHGSGPVQWDRVWDYERYREFLASQQHGPRIGPRVVGSRGRLCRSTPPRSRRFRAAHTPRRVSRAAGDDAPGGGASEHDGGALRLVGGCLEQFVAGLIARSAAARGMTIGDYAEAVIQVAEWDDNADLISFLSAATFAASMLVPA